jgi:inner membrane protein
MDVVSHGLASYALTRAIFPRISRVAIAGVIVAGLVADVDIVSAQFGPSAFLQWHRTYLHSVTAAVLIAIVVSVLVFLVLRQRPNKEVLTAIVLAAFGASLLHLAMDFCQNEQVQLFWPFTAQRYSADLLEHLDLWILLILLAGALLPQLLGLVTEEIGAKSKAPRGRIGAILALAVMAIYIGGRFLLHSNALAMMESRTYASGLKGRPEQHESPRKIAALAESDSPFRWHGIVETERTLRDLEVNVGPGNNFDPDRGLVSYKPEPSPPLEAAQQTNAARLFLLAARFPKASIEKTVTGYRVEIREFSTQHAQTAKRVMVVVDTDPNANVTSQEIRWNESLSFGVTLQILVPQDRSR